MKIALSILLVPAQSYANNTRKIIAILDTGVNTTSNNKYFCNPNLNKDFTNTGLRDVIPHGSHVFDIITNGLDEKKYCIVIVKWYDKEHQDTNNERVIKSFEYLITIKPDYLNLSFSGIGPLKKEKELLQTLLKNNTKIYVAAGNDGFNLDKNCIVFPACYSLPLNIVGSSNTQSNYGKIVTNWENGQLKNFKTLWKTIQGTSFSTPRALRRQLND